VLKRPLAKRVSNAIGSQIEFTETADSVDLKAIQLLYPNIKLSKVGCKIIPRLEFGSSQNDQASVISGAILISPLRAKQMGELYSNIVPSSP